MSEFEKAKKNLKNDMLALFILELIIAGISLFQGQTNLFAIVYAVLLFTGYIFAKQGKNSAGSIGIIVGILMMLTILIFDIIDFILGLFVFMHSIKYKKLNQ